MCFRIDKTEVKYGNPGLVSGGYWVAVEFKETLLRVGTPWADCTGDTLDTASYDVGTIAPILFGGPLRFHPSGKMTN